MSECCKLCRFWKYEPSDSEDGEDSSKHGWCRRYPPRYIGELLPDGYLQGDRETFYYSFFSTFAATSAVEWCGEFSPVTDTVARERECGATWIIPKAAEDVLIESLNIPKRMIDSLHGDHVQCIRDLQGWRLNSSHLQYNEKALNSPGDKARESLVAELMRYGVFEIC